MGELSVADVLNRAADLIEPEGKWGKGAWELDGCLCAEGAIAKAADIKRFIDVDRSPAGKFFEQFVGGDIVQFNDAPERTQAEVVAKLREAATLAQGHAA
jgi:hypothetical protein